MKLVVDTNSIISGSLWQGPPARLVSVALGHLARLYIDRETTGRNYSRLYADYKYLKMLNEGPEPLDWNPQTSCAGNLPSYGSSQRECEVLPFCDRMNK